ncbi:uncharacterized protein CEXT_589011 [Caerostris extrusa]|uniref:Uncharacterized protein n=1 Tax=Caerostris extrusa TaxID=172846 RepID=A0AAV4TRZ3_CAEEX|nr:uncharacterized protein CEXT_589011 [Caerostris extrusa]
MKRKSLSTLLYRVYFLGSSLNKNITPLWINIGATITLAIPILSCLCVNLVFEENYCKLMMNYLGFGILYVPDNYNCIVMTICILVKCSAVYILTTACSVLYIIICCFLRRLLDSYSMEVVKILRRQNIDLKTDVFLKYLATSESTVRILKSLERVMSFPIFLIAITDCANMFNGFLWLDPFKQIENRSSYNKYSLSTLFMSLRAVVSFLCVSLAASGVHESIKSSWKCKSRF